MDNTGLSPLTLNLIKRFEGYTAKPKWDEKQYSVGYSTRWNPGEPIGSREDHEAALAREVGNVDGWLAKNVQVPMTEEQRAALNSFGYNTGTGSLDRLRDDINSGDWDKVGKRMLTFSRAGDDPEALLPRRKEEVALLLGQGGAPVARVSAPAPEEGSLAPLQTAVAAPTEKGKDMDFLSMLAGGGLNMSNLFGGGGGGSAVPSMASGTSPDAFQNLFGTLGAADGQGGGGGGGGGGNMKLATDAMSSAASGDEAMPKMAAKPFDMQRLAAMLSKSGYLGTSQPRTA